MRLNRLFSGLVTLLNVSYIGAWIFVFNTISNQTDRQLSFLNGWFNLFKNINQLDITLVVLTLTSIVSTIWIHKPNLKRFAKITLLVHLLFLAYMLWSHL
ncbi:MAG: hypothetical protein ACI9NI_001188 [Olleya marilimosa]|jgi:hypothetical protein|uniref:hypothetical protein n=1 Tax=Olleya marilimosa TaxID=272164 RepID=UPI000568C717|nr:hypothetical protein [Olleya marilimosa]